MELFCENVFRGVLYINCVHLIQSRGILINCHLLFFLRAIYLTMIIGYCFQRSNGCNIVGMFICSFFNFFLVCVYTLYSVYIYRCVNQCACMCVCVQCANVSECICVKWPHVAVHTVCIVLVDTIFMCVLEHVLHACAFVSSHWMYVCTDRKVHFGILLHVHMSQSMYPGTCLFFSPSSPSKAPPLTSHSHLTNAGMPPPLPWHVAHIKVMPTCGSLTRKRRHFI